MRNLTSAFGVVVCLHAQGFAESAFERELTKLKEQRDDAVAAAVEPVERRYQMSLEQLLRRATQANDLEAAVKIKQEMKTDASELTKALEGSKWTFVDGNSKSSRSLEFRGGGALVFDDGVTVEWKAINGKTVTSSEGTFNFNAARSRFEATRKDRATRHGRRVP